jgi:hypothetical protein
VCDPLLCYLTKMWREATLGQKIGGLALFGNVTLMTSMLYQRHEFQTEEAAARSKWESSQDHNFRCFFAAKRYFDQCRLELDDSSVQDCKLLATELSDCKKELSTRLPDSTPAMRPLPMAFRT